MRSRATSSWLHTARRGDSPVLSDGFGPATDDTPRPRAASTEVVERVSRASSCMAGLRRFLRDLDRLSMRTMTRETGWRQSYAGVGLLRLWCRRQPVGEPYQVG